MYPSNKCVTHYNGATLYSNQLKSYSKGKNKASKNAILRCWYNSIVNSNINSHTRVEYSPFHWTYWPTYPIYLRQICFWTDSGKVVNPRSLKPCTDKQWKSRMQAVVSWLCKVRSSRIWNSELKQIIYVDHISTHDLVYRYIIYIIYTLYIYPFKSYKWQAYGIPIIINIVMVPGYYYVIFLNFRNNKCSLIFQQDIIW